MKSGELVLYDIAAASIMEKIEAHSGTIWCMHVRPDFGGVVTGSADKDVKFWDFEVKETENVGFYAFQSDQGPEILP